MVRLIGPELPQTLNLDAAAQDLHIRHSTAEKSARSGARLANWLRTTLRECCRSRLYESGQSLLFDNNGIEIAHEFQPSIYRAITMLWAPRATGTEIPVLTNWMVSPFSGSVWMRQKSIEDPSMRSSK